MKLFKFAAPLLLGIVYWLAVGTLAATPEPWDAPRFWSVAYPLSLVLAAVWGGLQPRGGWMGGALIVFAQMPVMLLSGGEAGPMLLFATAIALMLALPAAALAGLAGRLRGARR